MGVAKAHTDKKGKAHKEKKTKEQKKKKKREQKKQRDLLPLLLCLATLIS
jgi:hypothetical protein